MARNMQHYRETRQNFYWDVPDTFNFGADVVDRIAREADGPASIWENALGEQRHFRYSDIAELSARCANALSQRGIKKGDIVMIMLPRIPEWQIAMVGCLKLGAIPIPCIEMLTKKDLEFRMQHSGARGVICRDVHAAKFDGLLDDSCARIVIGEAEGFDSWQEALDEAQPEFMPVTMQADDPAILYYTSGSTGNPKGVLHAARALWAWQYSARFWLDIGAGDTIWCTADVGWSKAGTSILFGPWGVGACSFFYDGPYDSAQRLRLLQKHAITVYCAPGTELQRVLEHRLEPGMLPHLRHTVSAGETLSAVICDHWQERTGAPVLEGYGQTETLMTILNYPCMPVRSGSMGLPAPGLDVDVIDENGRRLPAGAEGDIAIITPTPQLMLGYLNDPQRTDACFRQGPEGRWFVTGDRGYKDSEGYFYYQGRLDDIINSSGYRIGPSEVENALLSHPDVLECAVVGAPDAERGEIVKAFVVARDGVHAGPELQRALQDHVKQTTAPYKYPRAITFMPELPKTQTGKIQRNVLRDQERGKLAVQGGR